MKSLAYTKRDMIGCQSLPGEVGTELVRFSYYACVLSVTPPASSQVDFFFCLVCYLIKSCWKSIKLVPDH